MGGVLRVSGRHPRVKAQGTMGMGGVVSGLSFPMQKIEDLETDW